MGVCNSSEQKYSLKFIFEGSCFSKQKLQTQVPACLPLANLFKLLKQNINKSENPSFLSILIKHNHKIYSSTSNLSIQDLNPGKNDKIKVIARPKSQDLYSIHLEIHCCYTYEETIEVGSLFTYDQILTKIHSKKTCCDKKAINVICNDLILNSEDFVRIEAGDKITAVFDENSFGRLKQPWKLKKSGLNLKGTCFSPECQAYKQEAFIYKHFGEFSREIEISDTYVCGLCGENMQIKENLVFVNCEVTTKDPDSDKKIGKIALEVANLETFEVCRLKALIYN